MYGFQKILRQKKYFALWDILFNFFHLFYLRFIEYSYPDDLYNWSNATDTPAYRAWSGYAFEQICLYLMSMFL